MALDLPPLVAELKANISEFKSKMSEAKGEMASVEKEGSSSFSKLGSVGVGALAAGGAAAVAFGASAVKAALEGEKADAQLETAIKNAGGSMEEMGPKVSGLSDHMAKFGFTNDETEAALAKLTTATGDPMKALNNMGLVADFAKARNIDLATAAQTVGKVMAGNVGALSRLGLSTKDAAGHTLTASAAMEMLQQKFGGQAQAQADTYAGKMAAFDAQFHNIQEQVGQALIPVIAKLMGFIVNLVQWFEKHRQVAMAVGLAIAMVLVPAIIAMTAAWVADAAAMIVALSPIIAIVAAVAAVAAGVILLWTHWDEVWNWIMNHKAIAAIIAILGGPIVAIIAVVGILHYLWDNWNSIWSFIQEKTSTVVAVVLAIWTVMSDAVTAGINIVRSVIESVMNFISALWSGDWAAIGGYLANAWEGIKNAVSTALATVVGFIAGLPGQALGALASFAGLMSTAGGAAISAIQSGADVAWGAVLHWFSTLPGLAIDAIGDVGSMFAEVGRKIIDAIATAIRNAPGAIRDAIISAASGALGSIGGVIGDAAGAIGGILGFASGGVVPGMSGSPIPAIVHAGELVLNPSQQANVLSAISNGASGGTNDAGRGDTHLHLSGTFIGVEPNSVGRWVVDALRTYQRSNGGLPFTLAA